MILFSEKSASDVPVKMYLKKFERRPNLAQFCKLQLLLGSRSDLFKIVVKFVIVRISLEYAYRSRGVITMKLNIHRNLRAQI